MCANSILVPLYMSSSCTSHTTVAPSAMPAAEVITRFGSFTSGTYTR